MGPGPEQVQIQKGLDPGQRLPEGVLEAETGGHLFRREADGVQLLCPGEVDRPFAVELLRDHGEGRDAEDVPGPDHRVQRPESGEIHEDRLLGHTLGHESLLHVLRLVVALAAVVPGNDDLFHLPRLVEPDGGPDPAVKILV